MSFILALVVILEYIQEGFRGLEGKIGDLSGSYTA